MYETAKSLLKLLIENRRIYLENEKVTGFGLKPKKSIKNQSFIKN